MTSLERQRTSCDWRSIIKSSKNGGFKIGWECSITLEFIWFRYNRGTSGKKDIKTLSVLCWWESVNSSTSSRACPWWSGKSIIKAGWALSPRAPRMGHVTFHLPEEPSLAAGGQQKSLNVQWKLLHMSFSHVTPEHVFLDICLPLRNRRLKNVSESLEGRRGGKGQRMQLFQHQDPWKNSLAGSSVSFFLKSSFLCCFVFTQTPSYTQGAAQVRQQTNCSVLGKELHKTPTALGALVCTLAKYIYSFTLKVGLAKENLSIKRKKTFKKKGESCCFN